MYLSLSNPIVHFLAQQMTSFPTFLNQILNPCSTKMPSTISSKQNWTLGVMTAQPRKEDVFLIDGDPTVHMAHWIKVLSRFLKWTDMSSLMDKRSQ